jgi:hypothetical protein
MIVREIVIAISSSIRLNPSEEVLRFITGDLFLSYNPSVAVSLELSPSTLGLRPLGRYIATLVMRDIGERAQAASKLHDIDRHCQRKT